MRPPPREVLVSSASRGLAPREGLVLKVLKVGHTRPSIGPCRGLQAGKSRYPSSQNTVSYGQSTPCLSVMVVEGERLGREEEAAWHGTVVIVAQSTATHGTTFGRG